MSYSIVIIVCFVDLIESKLTSLPNELFEFFLIYLSPCDIIQSFNGINKRLDLLIYRFIDTIDVSTKKKQWLIKHLFSIRSLITNLKFNHSQIQTLFSPATTIFDQYPNLKSILWNYQFARNDHLCQSYLNIFKTQLISLTLTLNIDDDDANDNITNDNNIALLLLENKSLLKQLIIIDNSKYSCLWFSFKENTLKMNQHLKELTIKLHYPHDLFILIKYLSNIEYLNVEICEKQRNDTYDYKSIQNKTTNLSRLLKELIINSLDFTYPCLLLFLEEFQQSIQLLTLNMSIYDKINGDILESTIIRKITNLKQFKFVFRIIDNEDMNINTGKK